MTQPASLAHRRPAPPPLHRMAGAAMLAIGLSLTVCGGSDSAAEAPAPAPAPAPAAAATLAGTAAVGAPITGGKLRIVDGAGNVVAQDVALGADGSFSGVTLRGSGPWRLEACGFAGSNWVCVHSVAQQGGIAHVTPLTSALVLLASGNAPEALMGGAAAGLDAGAVASAQAMLRAGLGPVLASAGVDAGLDLVTGPLAAGSRTGYDRLLDAVQVNTGIDGQPFVQIGSRLGSGNLYLEQGASAKRARPSARSAEVPVRSATAVAADDHKSVALYGRTGDGLGMQASFVSCPGTPAGRACGEGDAQMLRAMPAVAKRR